MSEGVRSAMKNQLEISRKIKDELMVAVELFDEARMQWIIFLMRLTESSTELAPAPEPQHITLNLEQHTLDYIVREFKIQSVELNTSPEWNGIEEFLNDLCSWKIKHSEEELLRGKWLTESIAFNPHETCHASHHDHHELRRALHAEAKTIKTKAFSLINEIGAVETKYHRLGLFNPSHFEHGAEKWKHHQLTVELLQVFEKVPAETHFRITVVRKMLDSELVVLASQKEKYEKSRNELFETASRICSDLNHLLKSYHQEQQLISETLAKINELFSVVKTMQEESALYLMQIMYTAPMSLKRSAHAIVKHFVPDLVASPPRIRTLEVGIGPFGLRPIKTATKELNAKHTVVTEKPQNGPFNWIGLFNRLRERFLNK